MNGQETVKWRRNSLVCAEREATPSSMHSRRRTKIFKIKHKASGGVKATRDALKKPFTLAGKFLEIVKLVG